MTFAILGTGGHAKSVYDIVKNKKKIYFFDKQNKFFKFNDRKFIVESEHLLIKNYRKRISKIIIAIGDNKIREKKYNLLKKNKFKFATLIHPKSYCSYGSKIGEGSVVMPGSLVNTDTVIGNNCIINSNASIDHDCLIKDHTHICPGVIIGGNVKIGKKVVIGSQSFVSNNIKICDNVIIAPGSIVLKNITKPGVYNGNILIKPQ